MYVATIFLLLGAGLYLCFSGAARPQNRWRIAAGVALILTVAVSTGLMTFWAEMLWFSSVGYASRFWTEIYARAATLALGAAAAVVLTWGLVRGAETSRLRRAALALAGLLGVSWGLSRWDTALVYLHRAQAGRVDAASFASWRLLG